MASPSPDNGPLTAEAPDAGEQARTGALVAIAADGSQTELVSAGLVLPGGVAVAGDGSFYVTNDSVWPDEGEMTGQLVHVILPEQPGRNSRHSSHPRGPWLPTALLSC